MGYTIALAGKGGTGKTTLSGLLIDYLVKAGKGPILAVDADANSNLNEVLGVKVDKTLGELRENVRNGEFEAGAAIPASMTKQELMTSSFADAITEEDEFDLLVMGRTQGEGCYCFVNGLLKTQIQRYTNNYKYIVVDNEAGMEHISRGVLPGVDMIIIVSDCSRRGVQAAARIQELAMELKMRVSSMKLIVNRAPDGRLNDGVSEEIEKHGFDLAGVVPADENVYEYDAEGRPTAGLPDDSPARVAFNDILKRLIG